MTNKTLRRIAYTLILLAVLSGLLALDLVNRGLFWQFAWNVTGEEEPLGQIRGMLEYAVTLTRPQPHTAPMTPVQYTNVNPYGINVFLQQEVEPEKVEAQLQMISDAGFAWIRQQFEWAEIEVDGRGQFTDSRNDLDGDGELDTIDAWIKYDRIVDLAEQYGIQIQARLDNPPAWSHSDPAVGAFAPPDDLQDFVNFAVAVAERYKGRIFHYQVWNEPNIYPEWGEQPVNPEAYTELLCRTYDALKAVDPNIVVISGALAPTISLSGRDLNDFIFLQRMYQAGAGNCFDIISVQGYGLNSGPTDRRMRPTTVNFARNLYIRDLMVANGDAHKPIWISEAAWNSAPTYEEVPLNPDGSDPITQRTAFGQVTQQQAAEYMPRAYQRAQEEWPWVGVVNYWFFTRSSDREKDQAMYYFRMVEPDYNPSNDPPFTPLPVYDAMKTYIAETPLTLHPGVHQVNEHPAVKADDSAQIVTLDDAQFGTALETNNLSFEVHGTHMSVRWRGNELTLINDTETQNVSSEHNGWHITTFTLSSLSQPHTINLSGDVIIDSVMVMDRSFENMLGFGVIGIIVVLMLMLVIYDGISSKANPL